MSHMNGMSRDEHAELVEAARECFRAGDIDEKKFRERLARLGYNASDIDREVEDNDLG